MYLLPTIPRPSTVTPHESGTALSGYPKTDKYELCSVNVYVKKTT